MEAAAGVASPTLPHMLKVGSKLNRGVYSSFSGDWATPFQLIEALRTEFPFTLDACASPETAISDQWFGTENGKGPTEWAGVVWCNPPYGKGVDEWIEKAIDQSQRGATVVLLLPARTDTKWFHELALPFAAEIRFLRGRLSFRLIGKRVDGRAPFHPSFSSSVRKSSNS